MEIPDWVKHQQRYLDSHFDNYTIIPTPVDSPITIMGFETLDNYMMTIEEFKTTMETRFSEFHYVISDNSIYIYEDTVLITTYDIQYTTTIEITIKDFSLTEERNLLINCICHEIAACVCASMDVGEVLSKEYDEDSIMEWVMDSLKRECYGYRLEYSDEYFEYIKSLLILYINTTLPKPLDYISGVIGWINNQYMVVI
jgi:hypothetical protein